MTKKGLLIDVLIYSSENPRAVEEEMQQYDIQFKLQIGIHYKYMKLLSEDLNEGQKSWFAAIDEVVFNCIKCIILSEKLRMIANQMTWVIVPKDHPIETPKDNIILESQGHQKVHMREHL